MSYIGLLNETSMTTYTNVSATDDLTVGTSLRNLGTLPSIDTSGGQDGVIRLASNQINTVTTPYGIWATIIQPPSTTRRTA